MTGTRVATDGLGDLPALVIVGCTVLAALLTAATGRGWLTGLGVPVAAYVALILLALATAPASSVLDGPVQMLAVLCAFTLLPSLGGAAAGAALRALVHRRSG